MQKVKLGNVIQNYDSMRKPLSKMARFKMQGNIPYYGANGIIDYVNESKFYGQYILLAEDGTVIGPNNNPVVFLTKENEKFWVSNHAHIFKPISGIDAKYLYYNLTSINILPYITGAVQLKITQENLNNILLSIHSMEQQRHIVDTI